MCFIVVPIKEILPWPLEYCTSILAALLTEGLDSKVIRKYGVKERKWKPGLGLTTDSKEGYCKSLISVLI